MALLVKSHHQMLASSSSPSASRQPPAAAAAPPPPPSSSCLTDQQPSPAKRKRRPPGTPDPDAEVVALSPRTLLESDRYVCEICWQGFQREQNLQMHRRRHKVPWRLVKRAPPGGGANSAATGGAPRKRVFGCPEPSCLHHDPAHALGDLWVCARCAKGYAVQSDYKAHLKTCGTRGHSCDCGRVFSRVESFIEHQDACNSSRMRGEVAAVPPVASTLPLSIGPTATTAASNGGAAAEEDAEELRRAVEEKAAEAAAAERALEEARRARQRARADLEKACALRDHAARLLAQVTCHACRQRSLVAVSVAAAVGEGHGHGGHAVACDPMRGGGVGAGI
ncbi:hypothetical protein C2845_PM01G08610 [Panicum miliaceum]|uniref:C2H2-type domain-containing protein n=1 Tax=Panicum miliaceum TaxID=4540 RepID=A0A3L6TKE8_PANMI|nr:hypothetical protein C2845_PM01G08610 [Panicum miliaceum]